MIHNSSMPDQPDQPKKVLIIEDEKAMAKALELKLNHSGFQAKSVFDGETALSLLKQEKFDLIILDLLMPRVDGFVVLQELRKRGDTTPVIVASNLGQEADIKKAKELGAKDYFVKSDISIAEVIVRIRKMLSDT